VTSVGLPVARRWLLVMALFLATWQAVAPAHATSSLSHPCCETLCDQAMPCGLAGCPVCADRALEARPPLAPLVTVADACPPARRLGVLSAPVELIWKPPRQRA